MFVSDKLIFIELQKTGSTHVRHLLKELLVGSLDGKHNAPTPEILARGLPILGSVRNPWSWYVSLWTYGCQKKGLLYQRLIDPARWQGKGKQSDEVDADDEDGDGEVDGAAVKQQGGPKKGKGMRQPLPPQASAERAAGFWYADPGNVEAFREWMSVVLSPAARHIVEAGYRRNPLSKCCGLMSYRYFKLFVRDAEQVGPEYKSLAMVKQLDEERCWVNHFIQSERLEDDFLKALAASGVVLTDEQVAKVRSARKRNVSERPLPTNAYYDEKTIRLVEERERFIIEKFGYQAPTLPTAERQPT